MILGINDGGFFLQHERYPKNNAELKEVQDIGCNAIEFRLYPEANPTIEKLDFSMFDWRSIHIAKWSVLDIYDYANELEYLSRLVKEREINNVVFHSGWLNDFDDMNKYSGIPWSMENLDKKAGRHRTVAELKPVFDEYPNLMLTLDIRHALSTDPTGNVLDELWSTFHDRIVEIHISGGDEEVVPCYCNHNEVLETFIKGKNNIPIIIESMYSGKEELKTEVEYVRGLIDF